MCVCVCVCVCVRVFNHNNLSNHNTSECSKGHRWQSSRPQNSSKASKLKLLPKHSECSFSVANQRSVFISSVLGFASCLM